MEIFKDSLLGKVHMLEHTNAYLDDHVSIWIAIPIISNYKNRMHEFTLSIKSHLSEEEKSSDGYSGQTVLQLKQQISDKMDILDDTLEAYAEDIGDTELRDLAANYYSDYYALSYEKFENKVTEMISLLETHVDKMTDYGLVQDQIDDVKLNLDEYQIGLDRPITYDLGTELSSKSLESLVQEATKYAEKLDHVMKRFKRSNVTFYRGYMTARTVHELAPAYA